MNIEYMGLISVEKHFVTLDGAAGCFIGQHAVISCTDGTKRNGRVVAFEGECAKIEVFEGTQGLSLDNTRTRLTESGFSLALSSEMLGRRFDGVGRECDGLGEVFPEQVVEVEKCAVELGARDIPSRALTDRLLLGESKALGLCGEDGLNRIFEILQKTAQRENSAVVLASVGNDTDTAKKILCALDGVGISKRSVSFICSEDSKIPEWTVAPLCAVTTAEYLAFERGYDVLVLLCDMSEYLHASRALSRGRGYCESDADAVVSLGLASIANRAGVRKDKGGSLTLLSVFSSEQDIPRVFAEDI